jgi:hypothetical protein
VTALKKRTNKCTLLGTSFKVILEKSGSGTKRVAAMTIVVRGSLGSRSLTLVYDVHEFVGGLRDLKVTPTWPQWRFVLRQFLERLRRH